MRELSSAAVTVQAVASAIARSARARSAVPIARSTITFARTTIKRSGWNRRSGRRRHIRRYDDYGAMRTYANAFAAQVLFIP